MARDRGPFKIDNAWPRIAWWSTAGLLAISLIPGFVVLGGEQQNGPTLGTWNAICRALGITADIGPAGEPRPPLRHPKVRDGVLLCAGAKVLGNVEIGRNAKVGAGSGVLHDVPP
jgi:acetyltransferase-like isoleucine patch superfamily enzyme